MPSHGLYQYLMLSYKFSAAGSYWYKSCIWVISISPINNHPMCYCWTLNYIFYKLQKNIRWKYQNWDIYFVYEIIIQHFTTIVVCGEMSWIIDVTSHIIKSFMSLVLKLYDLCLSYFWGGCGCEVSCGGHHRPRGKTTMGSSLDGAVFDIAQILAYLVHNRWADPNYTWGLAILADSLLFRSITFWQAYG